MQVNNDGVVSFETTFTDTTPDPFPLDPFSTDAIIIAPFWLDIDTLPSGTVLFYQTTNSTLLNRASNEIRYAFPGQVDADFKATNLFVASWIAVPVNRPNVSILVCIIMN